MNRVFNRMRCLFGHAWGAWQRGGEWYDGWGLHKGYWQVRACCICGIEQARAVKMKNGRK